MGDYGTIKELVIETCMNEGTFPSYEMLTSLVLKHFPASKWQKSHYAWYKSKIKNGEIAVPGFDSNMHNESGETDEAECEVQEIIDASLSLERDLHSYDASRVQEIEEGLVLVENGIEYQVEAGRIDLLARDAQGNRVVIEFKAGKAKDAALGQILGYMGCFAMGGPDPVRGILVASDFEPRVVYAARALPNVKLVKYRVCFELLPIS
ncbi:MAG: endonuclease NucS domain-containing protein [Candidatus Sumerlaeia bacterium]